MGQNIEVSTVKQFLPSDIEHKCPVTETEFQAIVKQQINIICRESGDKYCLEGVQAQLLPPDKMKDKYNKGLHLGGNKIIVNSKAHMSKADIAETVYHELRHIVGDEIGINWDWHEHYVRAMIFKKYAIQHKIPLTMEGVLQTKRKFFGDKSKIKAVDAYRTSRRKPNGIGSQGIMNVYETFFYFRGDEKVLVDMMKRFVQVKEETENQIASLRKEKEEQENQIASLEEETDYV